MECLVTGGSGFIGQYIVRQLAQEGHNVIVFDVVKPDYALPENVEFIEGDTRYYANLFDVCVDGIDEIFDVAGVLGTHELLYDNNRAVDVNINGTLNVLKVAVDTGVKRVFYPTKPNDWLNTYSITKYAAERFCLMYAEQFKLHVCVLKWYNAYGPGQKLYPIRKVVPMFAIQALRGLPIEIWGDGEQTVDMIHAKDIARFAIGATRNPAIVGKVCDVGSGQAITVNYLADRIIDAAQAITGCRSDIVHLPMRPGEPLRSEIRADVAQLGQFMKMEFCSLEAELFNTVVWFANLPEYEINKALAHFKLRNMHTKKTHFKRVAA